MYGPPNPYTSTHTQYAAQLRNSLEEAYRNVQERMGHQLDRQKGLYDSKIHGNPFEPGDKVWLQFQEENHLPWKGPYLVLAKLLYTGLKMYETSGSFQPPLALLQHNANHPLPKPSHQRKPVPRDNTRDSIGTHLETSLDSDSEDNAELSDTLKVIKQPGPQLLWHKGDTHSTTDQHPTTTMMRL